MSFNEEKLTPQQITFIEMANTGNCAVLHLLGLSGQDYVTCLEFMLDVARETLLIERKLRALRDN